jgi:hypothetical protein
MRITRLWMVGLLLAGCASTQETRLRDDLLLDVYWGAARECEHRYATLHVDRVGNDGALSLSADADSRSEFAGFQACYRQGIATRVERRRAAGLPVPETMDMNPDIDLE